MSRVHGASAETVEPRSTATRSYSLSTDDSLPRDHQTATTASQSQPVLAPISQIQTEKGILLLRTGNRNPDDVTQMSVEAECYSMMNFTNMESTDVFKIKRR